MKQFTRVGKAQAGIFGYRTAGSSERLWAVDHRDPAPPHVKRRKMGFSTRAEAISFREKIEKDRASGLSRQIEHVNVETAAQRYLEMRTAEGRRTSTSYYLLQDFAAKHGALQLRTITPEHVERWLESIARERGLSPGSRNRAGSQVSGLFRWSVARQWIDRNPCGEGRVARLPEDKSRKRWPEKHEVARMVQEAEKVGPWLANIIRGAASTGLRQSELLGLRVADVQTDADGTRFLSIGRTKNGDPFYFPLMGWMLAYVEGRVASARFPSVRLFPGPDGGNALSSLRRAFPAIVAAAGLPQGRKDGIVFHRLRASAASFLLNAGASTEVVRALGNWRSDAFRAYAFATPATLREAAARLDNVVNVDFADPPEKASGVTSA